MADASNTAYRLATVHTSGFRDVDEMAEAMLRLVNQIGTDILNQGDISAEQIRGAQSALTQIPQIFANFRRIIADARNDEDDKNNTLFTLLKMMDDLMSLGALASRDLEQQRIAFSVLNGATRGGVKSGETRRQKAEAGWKATARSLINKIDAANPGWSQDKTTSEVIALWQGDDDVPGHTTLKTYVSEVRKGRLVTEPPSSS